MRNMFLPILFAFILTTGIKASPTISFSGGGTNSESLFINLSEDFTLQVKPGTAVSSYVWGFMLSNSIAQDLFTSTFAMSSQINLITSQGAVLQTSNGATPITLTSPTFSFSEQNPSGYPLTITFSDQNEYILSNGGTITFTRGIMEIENNPLALSDPGLWSSQGFYVLKQQNLSFELNVDNIVGSSEISPGFNKANLQMVPEPSTYALIGLAAVSLVVAFRRRTV
jgi:hypothetical protein